MFSLVFPIGTLVQKSTNLGKKALERQEKRKRQKGQWFSIMATELVRLKYSQSTD